MGLSWVVLSRKPVGSCKDEVWAAKCVVGERERKLSFSYGVGMELLFEGLRLCL